MRRKPKKNCIVENCKGVGSARNLCHKHYGSFYSKYWYEIGVAAKNGNFWAAPITTNT